MSFTLPTPGGDTGVWGAELNAYLNKIDQRDGLDIRDYGSNVGTGSSSADTSAALALAAAASDQTVALLPSPQSNRYIFDADIPLNGFAVWRGIGSKQRGSGNYVSSERTPTVPIEFIDDHLFVNTAFDHNSALRMENLRVMGTNTLFSLRDAFLLELEHCEFEFKAAPAVAGTPPVLLDNCINFLANRCTFGYFGSYDYNSLYIKNSGSPGNNLGSGSALFTSCQFNGGGVWWEYITGVAQNPGAVTMLNCLGEGMTQGLLHLLSSAAGCQWTGMTVINSTINDSSTPTTTATVDVGQHCTLQDFNITGSIYTPGLRVRNGGVARHGNVVHAHPTSGPTAVFDAGSTVTNVETTDVNGRTLYGAPITLTEIGAPAAPGADSGVLYLQDNGSGKTQLMVKFSSGAAQQIAIQP